jgi:GNAT superfamily N-acetyltransferase
MWWRLTGPEYAAHRGNDNHDAFRAVVESGEEPGILAYANGEPVGWCAIAPRDAYKRLREERIRLFRKVDAQPVWSITCFFIAKPFRRSGVTVKLIEAAVAFAREHGANIIEGYPVEPKEGRLPDTSAYTGTVSAFRKAGFVEVLRRAETRPIMRYTIHQP